MEKTTLTKYLAERGLSMPISDFTLDKCRVPHGLSAGQRRKLEKETLERAKKYQEEREKAIAEYNEKLKNGEIQEKTKEELLIEKARYGHPDNAATQAARRVCDKRGLVWAQQNN